MSRFHPAPRSSTRALDLPSLARELAEKIAHEKDLGVVSDYFFEVVEDPRVMRCGERALSPDLLAVVKLVVTRFAGAETAERVHLDVKWCPEMKLAHGPFRAGQFHGVAFCMGGQSIACVTLMRAGSTRSEHFRVSMLPTMTSPTAARSRPS